MEIIEVSIDTLFPNGIIFSDLFVGLVSAVSAYSVKINYYNANSPSALHFSGGRYGKGEVAEFVIIEGQFHFLLGRVVEVKLPESDRTELKVTNPHPTTLDVIGVIQLLATIKIDNLNVTAGVETYPRLGDRVYAAPHRFVSFIPELMNKVTDFDSKMSISLGLVNSNMANTIKFLPEKLFGRHCAILGSTGGGKSWTTAKIIEECIKYNSKLILLDATAEYRSLISPYIEHYYLGEIPDNDKQKYNDVKMVSLPPKCFLESDFIAMFEPSGKVQGPKLKAAIKSLKLLHLKPGIQNQIFDFGILKKIGVKKELLNSYYSANRIDLNDPNLEFDVTKLADQIREECVSFFNNQSGISDDNSYSYCLSLISRIESILSSPSFNCVFKTNQKEPLNRVIDKFLQEKDKRLLRICLSGLPYEYNAREIIANVIGRLLLREARKGAFIDKPIIVFLDEAHNFLGKHIGGDDFATKLDSFEIIAKEGRKYGLNICLATQRPRDITEGVLSQIGTLIVHRLTNDKDRDVVERASGEIDRYASSFLPNLKQGEAVIIGSDFPIPLTIKIHEPKYKPISDGPDFQKAWK